MVEWIKLGDIGEVCMCKRIMKEQTSDHGDVPFFKIGTFGAEPDSYISKALYNEYKSKYSYPKKGDILLSAAGTIGRTVIFDDKDSYFQDSNIVWIDNNEKTVLNKYLFYYYQIVNWKTDGGTIKRLYNYNLKNILIAIPSKKDQHWIVGILDTFTSSIDNLKQQIAQRRKQYEYYRDQLLDLERKEGVEMRMLGEICDNLDYMRKPITSSKRKAGIYPYYGASGIVDYVEGFIFDGEYLLVSEDGANLVARTYPIAFSIEGKNWVNNHAHVLAFESKITQKFVEIYLNMIDLSPWINGAAQPKLNQANLNTIIIPVPSLSEQQRIVDILDKFEASIQNLEAQLSQREKQYEYYRNKLLTFE